MPQSIYQRGGRISSICICIALKDVKIVKDVKS